MNTIEKILDRLAQLSPTVCELSDDSQRHIGHAGAKEGGHYSLKIVSTAFAGMSAVARHRLVYTTIGTLMSGTIHALSITASSPDEVERE